MDEQDGVSATMAGRIASFYYLQHETMDLFMHHMHADADVAAVLKILASAPEYDELPVRLHHVALAAARSTPRNRDDLNDLVNPCCWIGHSCASAFLNR